jgi:hypothetical protein
MLRTTYSVLLPNRTCLEVGDWPWLYSELHAFKILYRDCLDYVSKQFKDRILNVYSPFSKFCFFLHASRFPKDITYVGRPPGFALRPSVKSSSEDETRYVRTK